ncbi:Transient receptor potential cation channel subfamily A member 1 [Trichoplax sp. H2]|nr:Transient receptor potential cation channel subfamily A member 1 [Trichoplax sp. H2]|eukprot:RDD42063.1 Transient receptor potential cation channel subfamily A member 1 [Trichoplax sp. H2]
MISVHGHALNLSKMARKSTRKPKMSGRKRTSDILMDSLRIVSFKEAPSLPSKYHGVKSTLGSGASKTIDLVLAARNGDSQAIQVIAQDLNDPLPIINACDKDGFSPLHYAAHYGHRDVISTLIRFGADPNIRGKEDQTPMHLAAKYNAADGLLELIANKADVNAKNQFGLTPLHFTSRRDFVEATKILLLDGKANPNSTDNDLSTPLHGAAAGGNQAVCKLLLENKASILMKARDQSTPLHSAAISGSTNIMRFIFLVAANFNRTTLELVDELDALENTPLHLAVQNGNYDAVQLCLNYGANPNSQRYNQATPLHLAAQFGHLDIAKLLVQKKARLNVIDRDRRTPMHKCALTNKLDIIKFLVEKKANIDIKDAERFTPFMCACWMGNLEIAKYLVEQDCIIDSADSSNRLCIHWAVKGHHSELLYYLLTIGCSQLIDRTDWKNQTPLHYSASRGDIEIVQILLEYEASLTSRDDEEKMPLHLAVENGHHLVAVTLIDALPGVINCRDEGGRTPLHLAAMHGHLYTVKELIERGADINSKDDRSWTPLDYAASKGFADMIDLLLRNYAAIHSVDKNKNTPLHLAATNGHSSAVNLLLDYGADPSRTNQFDCTPLDLAIENIQKDTALAFVNHKRWQEALSSIGKGDNPPMKGLIATLPDVAKVVMNRCITTSALSEQHPDFSITYNYSYLLSHPRSLHNRFFGLKDMISNNRETLLNHPLARHLLEYKWNLYGRWIYYPAFIAYVIYLTTVTIFMIYTTTFQSFNETRIETTVLQVGLVLMSCIALIIQLFQILQKRLKYFKNWTKVLDWSVAISILLYVVPAERSITFSANNQVDIVNFTFGLFDGYRPRGTQVAAGAVAILLAWCHFLLYLQRFALGTYVIMFVAVLKSVLRVLLLFSVFILGFGLSFFLLTNQQMDSFKTIPLSLLRVLIMMLGEIQFEEFLPHFFNRTASSTTASVMGGTNSIPFDVPAEVGAILAFFCILMPIILMNLLVRFLYWLKFIVINVDE